MDNMRTPQEIARQKAEAEKIAAEKAAREEAERLAKAPIKEQMTE